MREPRPIVGAKTPLFDRLLDDAPVVRQPLGSARAQDVSALRESVRADLVRLLNTRSSLRGNAKELAGGTVLDYGIPELSPVSAASQQQRDALSKLIEKAITRFEPRLTHVSVIVQQDKSDPQRLMGIISGSLVTGTVPEPVYFPLALDSGATKIDVPG